MKIEEKIIEESITDIEFSLMEDDGVQTLVITCQKDGVQHRLGVELDGICKKRGAMLEGFGAAIRRFGEMQHIEEVREIPFEVCPLITITQKEYDELTSAKEEQDDTSGEEQDEH